MEAHDLRPILEAAVRAPSVHNTQPWRFFVHPASAAGRDVIDVLADRERLLAVADPFGRELHISCGAAIELARIGGRSTGRSCTVHLLPDAHAPDRLAEISLGGAEPPTPEEERLAEAVSLRYTERGRFEDRPVPKELLEEMQGCAEEFETWVRPLDRPGDETVAAVLVARAGEIESANPEYESELTAWSGERLGASDGIPASVLPPPDEQPRGSPFRLRDFAGDAEAGHVTEERPPRPEHPLVVLFGTAGDDKYHWLQAGRALGRCLLIAASAGVAASPMTQVLEVVSTRAMLTKELGLVGHPQVLVRMGYAHGHQRAPRRPLDEVVTYSEGPAAGGVGPR